MDRSSERELSPERSVSHPNVTVPAPRGRWGRTASRRIRASSQGGEKTMIRSARHRSATTLRWVRGLIAGASLAVIATTHVGCGIDYVFRNISPLHVTGWSFAFPILPSQQARLEHDMALEDTDKVPILDPIPGEFAPASCLDPPSEAEVWDKVPKFKTGSPVFYETQRSNVRILIEKIGE